MKVIYISSASLPNSFANSYQTVKTCEALKRAGVDIELWAESKGDERAILRSYGLESSDLFNFLRIGKKRINHVFYSIAVLRKLRSQDKKTFVLYSRETGMWIVLLFAKYIWNVPFVFEVHRKESIKWHDALRRKLLLKKADGLVVISKALFESFKNDKKNIGLAFCGVEPKRFQNIILKTDSLLKYKLPEDKIYLGYAGGFEEYQGLKTLAKAFNILYKNNSRLGLFIAGGKTGEIESIKAYFTKEALGGVYFLGMLPFADVPGALAAADILVMPFENIDQGGSPVKMFEYLFMSRPIVSSRTPMIEEVLRDNENALLFSAGNFEELAEKISLLLSDLELIKRLASQSFIERNLYTFDNRAKTIKVVIEQAVR